MRIFSYLKIPLLVLLTGLWALSGACIASGPEADGNGDLEGRLRGAAELIKSRSYKDAEDVLLEIERSGLGERQKAYFLLGRLYREAGPFDKAENYLLKAADTYPLLKNYALILLADTYMDAGTFENVISTAGQIKGRLLAQRATRAEVKALLALKKEKEARDVLSQYIEAYPSDWEYKLTLAVLLDKSEQAVRLLKDIYINAVPESNSALKELELLKSDTFTKDEILKRADKLYEKLNFQRAETEYESALKLAGKAEKDRIRFSLGMCRFKMKQYDRAAETFGMVKSAEALYYKGWAFHRTDNSADFGKIKKEFRKKYPGDERLARLLIMEAEELGRRGRVEDSGKNYNEVIDKFPAKKEEALWGAAWLNYISGRYSAALQYFSQLATYEKSGNYYMYLYWKARTHERATSECLKHKVSAQPDDNVTCDSEGIDFFSGLPHDRSFYGYLIKMRSPGRSLQERMELAGPARPEGDTYDRIEALALLGMRDEAVSEIIDALKHNKNRNDFLYLGRIAMGLGEYRKIIAVAEKEEGREFLPYSFPFGFDNIIEAASASQDVDKYLVAAVIREESRFDPKAVSWAGAMGLMQLMPATANRLKKDVGLRLDDDSEIHDVDKNVLLGAHYLSILIDEFGDVPFALAAYNAGENALKRWQEKYYRDDLIEFIENIPYKETRSYVKKVLRSYWQYRALNGLPLEGPQMTAKN
ncbi:MAG: transglycosylase SLT domain-containing protein [Nitrospirae bacterium]|nr:transglycosylase SLT domain-containing protein [Nitrospirota bacterium]